MLDVTSPPCLPDYIKYMCGVDCGDKLITAYNSGRRSRKWWKKVFFHILELALLDSYILEGNFDIYHCSTGWKICDWLDYGLKVATN